MIVLRVERNASIGWSLMVGSNSQKYPKIPSFLIQTSSHSYYVTKPWQHTACQSCGKSCRTYPVHQPCVLNYCVEVQLEEELQRRQQWQEGKQDEEALGYYYTVLYYYVVESTSSSQGPREKPQLYMLSTNYFLLVWFACRRHTSFQRTTASKSSLHYQKQYRSSSRRRSTLSLSSSQCHTTLKPTTKATKSFPDTYSFINLAELFLSR